MFRLALDSDDPAMRERALGVLCSLAVIEPAAVELLEACANNKRQDVRDKSALILRMLKEPEWMAKVQAAWAER